MTLGATISLIILWSSFSREITTRTTQILIELIERFRCQRCLQFLVYLN